MADPFDVVVIGGGPAGLSAATALCRSGVDRVAVFEREVEAGGMPRHCGHPPFGMREFHSILTGPAYARRLVGVAQTAGVDIRTRHSVVDRDPDGKLVVSTPDGLFSVTARRILLATGARERSRAARLVSGARTAGVFNTAVLQDMIYLRKKMPFRRPVIVGTELVALSAVLTCLRHGIRPVAVIEEQEHATTRWPLATFPTLCGIPVRLGVGLAAIEGGAHVESVVVESRHGDHQRIACDGVLLTGKFVPEASLARRLGVPLDPGTGGPAIDQFGRTELPEVFATGNVLHPVETAGWCWDEGRKVGACIARDREKGLPNPQTAIPIGFDETIRYRVPTRLVQDDKAGGLACLNIRVPAPVSGHLALEDAQGNRLLRRRVMSGPERRITVSLAALNSARMEGAAHLHMEAPANRHGSVAGRET